MIRGLIWIRYSSQGFLPSSAPLRSGLEGLALTLGTLSQG
jgi:hypothetical protein